MDLNKSTAVEEAWTEEKHASFLNEMEGSFVKKTFGLDAKWMRAPLKLDRFIPDSATESNRSVMDLAAGAGKFLGSEMDCFGSNIKHQIFYALAKIAIRILRNDHLHRMVHPGLIRWPLSLEEIKETRIKRTGTSKGAISKTEKCS